MQECHANRISGKHIIRGLTRLSNKVRRHLDSLSFHGIYSGAEGRTLHFILANTDRELFQKDVEEEYDLRPPTASALLKKMEKSGLIRRESTDYDARLKRIVPTAKALSYEKQVQRDLITFETQLLEGVSQDELAAFLRVTEKMLTNLS